MKESSDMRFQPVDRRWNLLGMVVGLGLGAIPAAFPASIRDLVFWIGIGSFIGFVIPFYAIAKSHQTELGDTKFLFITSSSLAVLGGIAGAVGWCIGKPPEFEMGLIATCTMGFFSGFFVTDRYLRRIDARRREEERLWQRPGDS